MQLMVTSNKLGIRLQQLQLRAQTIINSKNLHILIQLVLLNHQQNVYFLALTLNNNLFYFIVIPQFHEIVTDLIEKIEQQLRIQQDSLHTVQLRIDQSSTTTKNFIKEYSSRITKLELELSVLQRSMEFLNNEPKSETSLQQQLLKEIQHYKDALRSIHDELLDLISQDILYFPDIGCRRRVELCKNKKNLTIRKLRIAEQKLKLAIEYAAKVEKEDKNVFNIVCDLLSLRQKMITLRFQPPRNYQTYIDQLHALQTELKRLEGWLYPAIKDAERKKLALSEEYNQRLNMLNNKGFIKSTSKWVTSHFSDSLRYY